MPPTAPSDIRPATIIARSLYRDLSSGGLDARQIVAVAAELIGEVSLQLGRRRRARVGE